MYELVSAAVLTHLIKHLRNMFSYLWIGVTVSLISWTIWKFFIWRDIPERILEQEELMKRDQQQRKVNLVVRP